MIEQYKQRVIAIDRLARSLHTALNDPKIWEIDFELMLAVGKGAVDIERALGRLLSQVERALTEARQSSLFDDEDLVEPVPEDETLPTVGEHNGKNRRGRPKKDQAGV